MKNQPFLNHVSCYQNHKPMPIQCGGKTYYIYGGSCIRPVVLDADVYLGFDYEMSVQPLQSLDNQPQQMLYLIRDMHIPENLGLFDEVVQSIANSLQQGKKVHVGCIGGHGRTGTFLAALVSTMAGVADPIAYVRKHYCPLAIETAGQESFIRVNYMGLKF